MKLENVVSYPPKVFEMKMATVFHPKGNTQLPNPTNGVLISHSNTNKYLASTPQNQNRKHSCGRISNEKSEYPMKERWMGQAVYCTWMSVKKEGKKQISEKSQQNDTTVL